MATTRMAPSYRSEWFLRGGGGHAACQPGHVPPREGENALVVRAEDEDGNAVADETLNPPEVFFVELHQGVPSFVVVQC